MRFYRTHPALRYVAIILFSIALASCGRGDGPEGISDSVGSSEPGERAQLEGFENPAAISFNTFEGAVVQIIPNPQPLAARGVAVAKPNLSVNVGEMRIGNRFTNFGGTVMTLPQKFGYADGEVVKIDVWASRPVEILFSLVGTAFNGADSREVRLFHPGNSRWEELSADFTGKNPPKTNQVLLIFDPGKAVSGGDVQANTFYFDNIFGGTDAATSVVGGGGGGGGGTATGGSVPDDTIYAADASTADLSPGFDPFGSNTGIATVADSSYTQALQLTVANGYGPSLAQLGLTGLPSFAGYDELLFKVKGLTADNTIRVTAENTGGGSINVNLNAPPAGVTATDLGGGWTQVVIALTAFGDVSSVSQLVFQTLDNAYPVGAKILLTDIGFNLGGGGGGGGPGVGELVANGTFETGDITGWDLVTNAGTFNATMDQAASGSWSGNLVASVPSGGGPASFPLATQVGIAQGVVTPGQNINVSFDICGAIEGIGGVFQSAILSEIAGGGASATNPLFGNITLSETWTNYQMSLAAGPDVSGGITLQLKADCGGNPGCTVNAYVDNVSVTLGTDTGNASNAGGACPIGGGGGGGGGGPVGDGNELLTNGGFEADPADKAPWINAGTVVANNVYTVDANDGGNVFDTNLSQVLELTNGTDYVLSFRAKASVERDIVVGIGDSGAPFMAALVTPSPTLTTQWQSFSFPLTANNNGGAASRVLFDLGTVASTVEIDDVSLELASAPGVNLLTNGDFEADPADKAPWINAGTVATNNFYTVDANDGGNVFDTNLSQVLELTNGTDYVLNFSAKASVERDIVVGIGDSGAPFMAALVTPSPTLTTQWQSFSFPLTANNNGGAASRVLFDLGTVASTVNIDDVSLQVVDTGGGGGGGSELAVNGDFETGDLTGWTLFEGGGIITAAATPGTPLSGGTTSGRLQAGEGQDVIFKQANLPGVSIGDTIDVSFDLYGSLSGISGVVFGQFFTELSGGGASADFFISPGQDGTPLTPTTTWTTYSRSITIASDVSGGVTLQLKAGCGAVAGCAVDAYFDNVTIVKR